VPGTEAATRPTAVTLLDGHGYSETNREVSLYLILRVASGLSRLMSAAPLSGAAAGASCRAPSCPFASSLTKHSLYTYCSLITSLRQ